MAKAKAEQSRFKEIRNSRAHKDYFIDETFEAGIALRGTEVKSIRAGLAQISEAFVRFEKQGPRLYHAHIAEYAFGTDNNHNPVRPRSLLLHDREIRKWQQELQSGGKTVVPLRMYFKKALVKVEIALVRSKKAQDKRQDLKKADAKRETERYLKQAL